MEHPWDQLTRFLLPAVRVVVLPVQQLAEYGKHGEREDPSLLVLRRARAIRSEIDGVQVAARLDVDGHGQD